MRVSVQRIILGVAGLVLLGGCTSNCNILSSSNSLGCDLAMGAGAILAAPIVAPAVLLSDAASDAKAKRMAREWRGSMQTRLSQGDAGAVKECLAQCLHSWIYELDYRDRRALSQKAAQLYLADSSIAENIQDHEAYSVLAHYFLAWQPESTAEEAPFRMDNEQSKQAYELLKEESTRARLQKLLRKSYYSDVIRGTYAQVYAGSLPGDDAAAQERYKQCPKEIQDIMLEEQGASYKNWACSSAYYYRFGQRAPENLLELWREQQAGEGRLGV